MDTRLSVTCKANPNSVDQQSSRKFDLTFEVDVEGAANLTDLSDIQVYELVHPHAVDAIRAAAGEIRHNTRSELSRTVDVDCDLSLDAKSKTKTSKRGFKQHQLITGHMIVDANDSISTGESWLLGQPQLQHAFAENVVTSVLIGLGREAVDIEENRTRSLYKRSIQSEC